MLDKYGYSDRLKIEAARKSSDIKEENILIVSKDIRDPHYESYVYSFVVKEDDRDIRIVSYFMKELYLGRYLIKRNFYFKEDNKKSANEMFENLLDKTEEIRDLYYSSKITNQAIFKHVENYLEESKSKSDFVNDDDSLGTTVNRKSEDHSTVDDWFARGEENLEKLRQTRQSSSDGLIKTASFNLDNVIDKLNIQIEDQAEETKEDPVTTWFNEKQARIDEIREFSFSGATE